MDKKAAAYRRELAEKFLNVLDKEGISWMKTWSASSSTPVNAKTGKNYKGINRFHLMIVAAERGYKDPRWLTYLQIQEKGLKLENAKGQGVRVEYWYPYDLKEKRALKWKEYNQLVKTLSKEEAVTRFLLNVKYATVFSAELVPGIEPFEEPPKHDIKELDIIHVLEKNMNVPVIHDQTDRCFYKPTEDAIHLPPKESFFSDYAYHSTALHEFGHATGAASRLNRNLSGGFGSESYAFEELVAEMTSCFLATELELFFDDSHIENHMAYVKGWCEAIQKNPEVLPKAVAEAEKAAAYLEEKAGLITMEERVAVEESVTTVREEQEAVPEIQEQPVLYRRLPERRKEMEKPYEIWVGDLAEYTEGKMDGRWISLPMKERELEAVLDTISKHGEHELIIMDLSVRKDCSYMRELIGEWTSIRDLNTIAALIGETEHPVVEAYCSHVSVSSLPEVGNLLAQENELPFTPYEFNGSDNPQVMKNLSPEEKYGYTMLESSPNVHLLEEMEIGTSTLMNYIDVEAIGRDASMSGYVSLYEDGFINARSSVSLDVYTMKELRRMAEEPQMEPQEEPTPAWKNVPKTAAPKL